MPFNNRCPSPIASLPIAKVLHAKVSTKFCQGKLTRRAYRNHYQILLNTKHLSNILNCVKFPLINPPERYVLGFKSIITD